jgi:hypothetical protein
MIDAGLEEPDRRTVSTTGLPQCQVVNETMSLRNAAPPEDQSSCA